jgi:2-methylcitrate dehydratase
MPLLLEKFKTNLATRFAPERCRAIIELCSNPDRLDATPVDQFLDLFAVPVPGAAQSSAVKVSMPE